MADREARRETWRKQCQPQYEGPMPTGVNAFGLIMTGIGLLAAVVCLILLGVSVYLLFKQRALAGEKLFGAGVGLVFALFFARVWHEFLTLADWRVALDVPLRAKVFAATGAAVSATLAGGAVALLLFAICSKTLFLRVMDGFGAGDVGKVQVIFTSVAAFFYFVLLWYLFQGLMELRERARLALSLVLDATVVLAGFGVMADLVWLSRRLGNGGVGAACLGVGVLALVGLLLGLWTTERPDAKAHFRADEF